MGQSHVMGFVFDTDGNYALASQAKKHGWRDGAIDGICRPVPWRSAPANITASLSQVLGLEDLVWSPVTRLAYTDCDYHVYASVASLAMLRRTREKQPVDLTLVHMPALSQYRMLPVLRWVLPMAHFHMFCASFDRIGFLQVQHGEEIRPEAQLGSKKAAKSG